MVVRDVCRIFPGRVVAVGLALGLLLMHGIDARAVADGHGLPAAPSAAISAVQETVGHAGGMADAASPAAASPSVLGHCMAALTAAAMLVLVALRTTGQRLLGQPGGTPADRLGAHPVHRRPWRTPPETYRIALCVSLR